MQMTPYHLLFPVSVAKGTGIPNTCSNHIYVYTTKLILQSLLKSAFSCRRWHQAAFLNFPIVTLGQSAVYTAKYNCMKYYMSLHLIYLLCQVLQYGCVGTRKKKEHVSNGSEYMIEILKSLSNHWMPIKRDNPCNGFVTPEILWLPGSENCGEL